MRSPERCVIALGMGLALLLLSCDNVHAGNYGEFTGVGIDSSRWEVRGEGFSQPGDGYLHFSAAGATFQSLVSKARFPSGIFTLSFRDYSCDNQAPPGRGLGSILGLGLGDRAEKNWLRIERGQIQADPRHGITGGYLEVNWVVPGEAGTPIHVNWVPSEINAGSLQIRYDGTRVSFFYRTESTDHWTQMVKTGRGGQPITVNGETQPLVLTPGWTTAVPMFIHASPGGGPSDRYTLSFKLGGVEADPMPDVGQGAEGR
jgi:hypothetical protein